MAPSAEPTRHSFTLRSHLSETSHARGLVLPFAIEAGFSEEACFDIQVAASEACANAIEHSPPDSEVEFAVLVYPDRLEIQVEGRGQFELPSVAARERVHRGLGLPLMAKLSDHMSLYSGPRGGTLVSLTFYRPGFQDTEETDDITPPWIRELVEETELVAAITDTAPVGLYVLSPELRYRWANPAYREFLEEPYCSQPLEGVYAGDAVPGSAEMGSLEIIRTVSRTGERAFFPEYAYVGFARGITHWRWEILPLRQNRVEPPYDVLVVISEITEQVEQRKGLESASRKYRALAENSGLALALCRTVFDGEGSAIDFEYIEVNAAHDVFSGYPAETFLGRRVTEAIPGYSRESIDRLNRVALTGEPIEEEIYEPYLERWYRLNAYSPESGYFVSLARDISERVRAEEALRSSAKTFAELVERSPYGTYIVDSEFRIAFMNASSQTGAFRNVRPLIGRPFTEAMHTLWPDDVAEGIVSHFRHTLETGEPYYSPRFTNPRHDVEVVESYEWELHRLALPDGQLGVICYYFDSTDLRDSEEALRRSEEKYRTLFNSIDEGFFVIDVIFDERDRPVDLLYVEANAEATRIVGQDYTGRRLTDIGGGYEPFWFETFGGVASTGESVRMEEYAEPDKKWYEFYVFKIGGPESRRIGNTFRDVTERKRAEEARRRSEESLGGLLAPTGKLRLFERRKPWRVLLVGIILQAVLLVGVDQLGSPRRYLGIPGAAAALIGVLVAITAGPIAGVLVSLAGGVVYFVFITDLGSAVAWLAIVISILLWTAAAALAGLGADWIRQKALQREALLGRMLADRETLTDSITAANAGLSARNEELALRGQELQEAQAETTRVLDERTLLFQRLQESLLDIPTELSGVKFGHLYRSATEQAQVGGDFYDVFEAKDGRIGILIGDVAGHGIEAARSATLVKDVVHAFIHQTLQTEEVVRRTNGLLIEKHLRGFVTLFLGILDPGTGELRYSSAGHPDMLVRRASGEIEHLGAGSSPLGINVDAAWKPYEVRLDANDLLVLFTDGVIEARRNGELFGEERLDALVKQFGASSERLPHMIFDQVLAYSGGVLQDDVAILTLLLAAKGDGGGS